ncbi:cupin domain-containing protein [Streptomyces abikoensis]|uniref:Cupin domain-containing protein n=1 Tax=Streptomyces abikoensis TaxID=97398 RepID=A0ABW7T9M5_9ACTN
MSSACIAERLGEGFLAQALHRDYRYVPDALDVRGLMTWDDLDGILATHRLESPRLRLSRDGQTLALRDYTEPVTTRRHTVWHRLHPAQLHARLAEGASLTLDSIDELHRPLAHVAEDLERAFRTRLQANLYASWTAVEGFGTHWDDHDVVVLQLDGAKRWRIYGPTRSYPLDRDTEEPVPPTSEPIADLVLRPGDLLYVPRGWWHAVSADQGTRSLHVTYGLQPHTPTNLIAWIGEKLLAHEEFRADLPRLAPPGEQAAFLARIRKLLDEQFDDPHLLTRYTADRDAQALGRMSPSLPYLTEVPAIPGVRVWMTTARAVLTVTEDAVRLAAGGTVYEFAPAAGPALRALVNGGVHTLDELARTAQVEVADIASLVQELVTGQVAAVGEPL